MAWHESSREGLTIRDLRDLAQRNARSGRLDLRLAIAQRADVGLSHDLSADDLAVAALARAAVVGASTRQNDNLDGGALGGPAAVVQVEEVAALALVEDGGAAQRQRAVAARREARRVDGARLRGLVVLELEVGRDVARAALGVQELAVFEGRHEDAVAGAGTTRLRRRCVC